MKVAFVLARVDCNDGVAAHIELLASELVRRGVEIAMVTGIVTGETLAPDRYAAIRSLVSRWDRIGDEKVKFSVASVRKMAAKLRGQGFDHVHVHGLGLLSTIRLALLGAGLPIVATYHPSAHGNAASDFKLTFTTKQRAAYRGFLTLFGPDKLIAQSLDTDALFVDECGLSRERVARIIAGIDLDDFRPASPEERAAARQSLGIPDDALVCVLPGRLNLNKGHDVAVAAFDRLREAHPGRTLRCIFPGGGAQKAEIAALCEGSSDPAMFIMPGFVPAMREMYWAADIVILPSRNEGFALVVAEAMACGCAAIRTPSGGCTDQIIEGQTGFAVGFNDPASLADRIGQLLDPARLTQMRAAALAHAKSLFSGTRMADETMALYRRLTKAE